MRTQHNKSNILLWLESFQLRGKSQNTVNNKLAAIKSLFGFGVKTGYLANNPASMINKQLTRSDKTEAVFLSRFGNRLDRHAIHRLIKKAVEKAGINPHTSAH